MPTYSFNPNKPSEPIRTEEQPRPTMPSYRVPGPPTTHSAPGAAPRTAQAQADSYTLDARKLGIEPPQFTLLIDALATATGRASLIGSILDSEVELNGIKNAVLILARMDYKTPDAYTTLLGSWRTANSWMSNPVPNVKQFLEHASKVKDGVYAPKLAPVAYGKKGRGHYHSLDWKPDMTARERQAYAQKGVERVIWVDDPDKPPMPDVVNGTLVTGHLLEADAQRTRQEIEAREARGGGVQRTVFVPSRETPEYQTRHGKRAARSDATSEWLEKFRAKHGKGEARVQQGEG